MPGFWKQPRDTCLFVISGFALIVGWSSLFLPRVLVLSGKGNSSEAITHSNFGTVTADADVYVGAFHSCLSARPVVDPVDNSTNSSENEDNKNTERTCREDETAAKYLVGYSFGEGQVEYKRLAEGAAASHAAAFIFCGLVVLIGACCPRFKTFLCLSTALAGKLHGIAAGLYAWTGAHAIMTRDLGEDADKFDFKWGMAFYGMWACFVITLLLCFPAIGLCFKKSGGKQPADTE